MGGVGHDHEGGGRYSRVVPIRSGAGVSSDDPRSVDSQEPAYPGGPAADPAVGRTVDLSMGDGSAEDPAPRDACGVFGVFARSEEVAKLAYYGLYALQHRGQEAAGIAVAD